MGGGEGLERLLLRQQLLHVPKRVTASERARERERAGVRLNVLALPPLPRRSECGVVSVARQESGEGGEEKVKGGRERWRGQEVVEDKELDGSEEEWRGAREW
eukprot:1682085-Rhodomonas_salina.1